MNWNDYKFHPSSLGAIMTDGRGKSEGLGETCKNHLLECWVAEKYGRERELDNKYIKKGLMVEEDSITLYSRVNKRFFTKNDEQISNDYLIGTPDLFVGPSIKEASEIIDLKSSWDIFTFFHVLTKTVNKMYYWQLQGYMDLTGAQLARLCYCLVDTPLVLIEDQKRRLLWEMGGGTELNPLYIEACEKIDKAMTFSDIPIQDRFIEFVVKRNQEDIDKAHARANECRIWLSEFNVKELTLEKAAA